MELQPRLAMLMEGFLHTWNTAATTTLGLFWTAFWAFGLGYLFSSMIQVFVTRERMQRSLGDAGPRSILLATFFGFLSSSCSFAALATTRALFSKGAGLIPSLAFLLASTNLVVELGIVIAVFLSWHFVVAEYVGGILLILLMWILVAATCRPRSVEAARARARSETRDGDSGDVPDWTTLIRSREGWRRVANRYVMEWKMVWKDVTIGFSVAGIVAAFIPDSFFQALFVGSTEADPTPWQILLQVLVGPVAAFFTFIGSMGNIPLAAVLYDHGVSFAGVMAFIFSDLVVLPVVRIQARYYGWRMALYLLTVFLVVLVASAMLVHYGFALFGVLPDAGRARAVTERTWLSVDHTLVLNVVFASLSAVFLVWKARTAGFDLGAGHRLSERVLTGLALIALLWLAGGLAIPRVIDL